MLEFIRKSHLLVLISLLVVLALLTGLVMRGLAGAQEGTEVSQTETETDSVRFSADLRAAEKAPELVGQYAWTSINGQVVESRYSTEPQRMETGSFGLAGNACAHGGAGEGCLGTGDAASASTTEGSMRDIEGDTSLLIIGLVIARANVSENFTTGARCSMNEDGVPQGIPQQPTGALEYAGWALLGGRAEERIDFADIGNGEFFEYNFDVGVLLNLLLSLYVDVEVQPRWGWDEENLRAYSEVTVHYQVRSGSGVQDRDSFTARSECGMLMSDGRGSTAPAGMGAQTLAGPMGMRSLPEQESAPTSAPGTPQAGGFTHADHLEIDGVPLRYHLLATRELGLADRREVEDVLAASQEPDAGVEGRTAGARWQLFSAEAAGELVPVLEVTLDDGAVIQVRPELPGVQLPAPDVVEVPTTGPTTPTEATPTGPPATTPTGTTVTPTETAPAPESTATAATTEATTEPADD